MEGIADWFQRSYKNLLAMEFYWVIGAGTLLVAALWFCFPRADQRWWLFGGSDKRNVGRAEGFALRLLFAWVVWVSFSSKVPYQTVNPKALSGLANLMDVTIFAQPGMQHAMYWLVGAALLVYVSGFETAVSLTVVAFFHCGCRALNNSQGFAHHGFQIIGLALLAQMLVAWVVLITRIVSRARQGKPPAWSAGGNWTWHWYMTVVFFASTYVMTAVTKYRESDGRWLQNSHFIATQIVKTHRQNYYKGLDEEFNKGVPPAAQDAPDPANDRYRFGIPVQAEWMRSHPALTRLIFGAGFCLEAFAFVAIFNRWTAAAVGVAVVAFHLSVQWLMQLEFVWNCQLAWIFLINVPGILILCLKKWKPQTLGGEGVGDPLPVVETPLA